MHEVMTAPMPDQTDVNARFDDMMAANNFMLEHNPAFANPMDAFQGFESLNYDALKDHEEEVAEAVGQVNVQIETFSVDALHFAYEMGLAQQAQAAARAFEAEQAERAERLQVELLDKQESDSKDHEGYGLAA